MTLITSSIDVTVETTTVTSENQINEATFEVNTDNEGTTIAELNISNQISELVELTHEVHSDTMNYVVETTGAVNGLSAYELWILQDNAGTVEDFLDSLIGPGVPAGGTAGQILSKIDGTDYNTHWIAAPVSGVSSFNSRTGDVLPAADDYAIADITGLTTALSGKEGTITAGTTSQYWRGDKSWQTLDKTAVGLGNVDNTSDANKPVSTATQTALNLKENSITAGTTLQYWRGDKTFQTLDTSIVPENTNLYYTDTRVRATALTGLSITGSAIVSTDTILQAFGKAQNQINALVGGVNFQGTWNATTNSPTITGGAGTKGYYYVVSVAGSTSIDGITDWKLGDWIIYNGTAWQKVDNTDAVVSVNGYIGIVTLTTSDIAEGSRLYYTDERAQDAIGAMVNATITYSDGTPSLGINLSNANTWLADISVPDEVYGVGWNGSVEVPTKNALYDKIEAMTITGLDTQIMYFNGANTPSGDAEFIFKNITKRVGIQVANPDGPLHVDVQYGQTIDPPASITLGYTLDTTIDSPVSASATQVDGPSDPNSLTFSFIYIDYVYDNMWYATQNTGGSGFTAYGQSFTWNIYAYRNVGGTRVVNPSSYAIYFTDSINDSSTGFQMDIGGWTTANGYQDGFIVQRYDSYTGQTYYIDIGNSNTYSDTGFTNTDAYVASQYASAGSLWNMYVAQYKTVNGTKYRTGYQTYSDTDANPASTYLILSTSWSAVVNDGFYYLSHNSQYHDVTTANSFYDYGQGGSGDTSAWSASAFPYFNTSLTNSSVGGSFAFNYGSGGFTADSGYYYYEIWEYRNNAVDGLKYFISSPATSSTIYDDNSSNAFTLSDSFSPGDGDGRVILLYKNGSLAGGQDVGAGTSFNFSTETAPAVTPSIGSYTGILRNFSAYGYITSPSTKYSSTHNDYSFTDNNPTTGYMIAHSWATPGNAIGYKVLESSYRSGSMFWQTVQSSFTQDNAGLGDATVTPNTVGFLGNGTTYYYDIFSLSTALAIYSQTPVSSSIALPNDGLYYVINISHAAVSGATYKYRRKIGAGAYAYKTNATTSLDDYTTISWGATNTLTPDEYMGSTAIFDRATAALTEPAIVKIRNTTTSAITELAFQFNQSGSGTYTSVARIGTTTAGVFFISTGNVGSGGFQIQDSSLNSWVTFGRGAGTSGNIFNAQGSVSRDTTFKGSSSLDLIKMESSLNTVYVGNSSLNYDPVAAMVIKANDGTDLALQLYPNDSASTTAFIFQVKNSSQTVLSGITNLGKGFFADSTNGFANLRVGGGNTTYASFNIQHSSSMKSSPQQGDIEQQSGSLYFTNSTPSRRRIQVDLTSSSANQFWYSDANGYATSSAAITTTGGSLVIIGSSFQLQAKNGIAIDSGKDLGMNGTGSITGPIRTTYLGSTANVTINATNHIYNATANSFNYTLPTAVSISGREYYTINSGSGVSTLLTTSSQTINGLASGAITLTQRKGLMLISDGANWISPGVLASAIVGTVATTDGGTGLSTYTTGDILYASATNVLSKLAKDTNATRYLSNTGASNIPAWSQINMANGVTGILAKENGGTGVDNTTQTYTPTLTGVLNVASSVARLATYMRVGNMVIVSGQIDITATANNTETKIGISLPIASNFSTAYQLGGSAHTTANSAATQHGGAIYADSTNDRAEFDYYETHGTIQTFTYMFSYQVI